MLAFGVLNLQPHFAIDSTFAYKSKHVFEEQNHLLFILYQFFHISCSLVKNWLDIYPHFKIYILFCIYEIMTCNIKQLFLLYKLLNTFIVSVYYIYKFLNNIVDAKPPQNHLTLWWRGWFICDVLLWNSLDFVARPKSCSAGSRCI